MIRSFSNVTHPARCHKLYLTDSIWVFVAILEQNYIFSFDTSSLNQHLKSLKSISENCHIRRLCRYTKSVGNTDETSNCFLSSSLNPLVSLLVYFLRYQYIF